MTRIKYLIFPVIFFLIFSFFFSQSRVFAGSYSSEKQVGSTTNTCSVNISWKEYRGQRKIYYGNWDGTYTVFLYRSGEDRDHYLARRVTSDTRVRIENLPAGSSYVAEVFLTGAFLNPDVPYWAKLSSFPCNQTSLQKNKVEQTQPASTSGSNYDIMSKYHSTGPTVDVMDKYDVESTDSYNVTNAPINENPDVLPDTGWKTWVSGLAAASIVLFGVWLFGLFKFQKGKLT